MKVSRIKNGIAYVLLVLFLSIKIVGLHALTHLNEDDDHPIHCSICDNVTTHNLTPVITPLSQVFPIKNTEMVMNRVVLETYSFILTNRPFSEQIFSRPPPFIV